MVKRAAPDAEGATDKQCLEEGKLLPRILMHLFLCHHSMPQSQLGSPGRFSEPHEAPVPTLLLKGQTNNTHHVAHVRQTKAQKS